MPPQEAPTTIRPEGNSLPSPPAPPRRGPTPRNRGEEASGVGEKGGRTAGGNRTQESRYQSVSKKRGGGGYPRCLGGKSGTQKPSWYVRKPPRWLQRGCSPRAPAGLPATPPDRARPRETPSIGPPPKTAPAALYSLCPRSCSPLHHSCRPGAPQN